MQLDASTSGSFDFTVSTSGSLTVSSTGLTGPGYSFGSTSFPTGPLNVSLDAYPVTVINSQTFSYSAGGDQLDGLVSWTAVTNASSLSPGLMGTLVYGNATGDASFLADFGPAGVANIDLVVSNLSARTFLDGMTLPGVSELGTILNGSITPTPVVTPPQQQQQQEIAEPASIVLLASGLFVAWRLRCLRNRISHPI